MTTKIVEKSLSVERFELHAREAVSQATAKEHPSTKKLSELIRSMVNFQSDMKHTPSYLAASPKHTFQVIQAAAKTQIALTVDQRKFLTRVCLTLSSFEKDLVDQVVIVSSEGEELKLGKTLFSLLFSEYSKAAEHFEGKKEYRIETDYFRNKSFSVFSKFIHPDFTPDVVKEPIRVMPLLDVALLFDSLLNQELEKKVLDTAKVVLNKELATKSFWKLKALATLAKINQEAHYLEEPKTVPPQIIEAFRLFYNAQDPSKRTKHTILGGELLKIEGIWEILQKNQPFSMKNFLELLDGESLTSRFFSVFSELNPVTLQFSTDEDFELLSLEGERPELLKRVRFVTMDLAQARRISYQATEETKLLAELNMFDGKSFRTFTLVPTESGTKLCNMALEDRLAILHALPTEDQTKVLEKLKETVQYRKSSIGTYSDRYPRKVLHAIYLFLSPRNKKSWDDLMSEAGTV